MTMRDIINRERERLLARLQELRNKDTLTDEETQEVATISERLEELKKLEATLESETKVVADNTNETKGNTVSNSAIATLASKARTMPKSANAFVSVVVNAQGNTGAVVSQGQDTQNVICSAVDGIDIEELFTVRYTDRPRRYVTWKFTDAGTTECGGLKKQMVGTPTPIENNFTKFAGYVTVDDCVLEDDEEFGQLIRDEVATAVARERLKQIIVGGTGATDLDGLQRTNGIGEIVNDYEPAEYGYRWVESLVSAVTQVQASTGMNPDAIIVSPDVWQGLLLMTADSTGSLTTLVANGSDVTLLGVKVYVYSELSSEAFVGNFKTVQVDLRKPISVEAGYTEDNFIYDLTTIRGHQRGGVAVTCPQAIVHIHK